MKHDGLPRHHKTLADFVLYCSDHPDERFWQALRNWCGWPFVLVTKDKDSLVGKGTHWMDTFYWQNRDK